MSSPDNLPLNPNSPNSAEPSRQSLVIIGAGMATHALLRQLAQLKALDHYHVTVIGEEPRPCYDRVHLTECFTGKTADDLLLDPVAWYSEHGIELITGDAVTRIDRETRTVHAASGLKEVYHRLVLATGSCPFVPPIKGVDLPGVFVYRTIEDIEQIKSYAKGCQTAAVFGGGLLGLEAGKALHDLKLETHVLEVAPSLMPRQLNAEAGVLLKQEIEKLGVHIHLLRGAKGIEEFGEQKRILFDREETLEVDMIVISAGIRPR
ncbi:MAG: FAD-dependent oxidoreductase, partial [Lacipirellulaceae bacterium]